MVSYLDTLLDGLCRQLTPRHIVLAGARDPARARAVLQAAMRIGATLHIAGAPAAEAVRVLRQEGGDACLVHEAPAPLALGVLPVPQLCWIDGDPNWFTVHGTLTALEAQAARLGGALPVVVIEGAGWPHGRRDGYDDPAAIPEAFRLPHERAGLLPDQAMPAGAGGLYADGYHASAQNEPSNGVLTAVEDFIDGRTGVWRQVFLPGFGGRVALAPRGQSGQAAFAPAAVADYLRATAEALESVRLAQAVSLADAEAELARVQAVSGLLRAELARLVAISQPAPAPPPNHPAWRTQLRPAVHLAGGVRRRLARSRAAAAARDKEAQQAERLRASPIFDGAWYLDQYGDVAAAGLDPALHYLRSGAAEMRDPGPFFSTAAYLAANSDVAEAQINPLLHYLISGAAEGRRLGGVLNSNAHLAEHQAVAARGENPLEHFIALARADASSTQA